MLKVQQSAVGLCCGCACAEIKYLCVVYHLTSVTRKGMLLWEVQYVAKLMHSLRNVCDRYYVTILGLLYYCNITLKK